MKTIPIEYNEVAKNGGGILLDATAHPRSGLSQQVRASLTSLGTRHPASGTGGSHDAFVIYVTPFFSDNAARNIAAGGPARCAAGGDQSGTVGGVGGGGATPTGGALAGGRCARCRTGARGGGGACAPARGDPPINQRAEQLQIRIAEVRERRWASRHVAGGRATSATRRG